MDKVIGLKESGQPEQRSIDQGLIDRAIKKSPSGNNAQPFNSSWREKVLLIAHDVTHAQHYLNRGDHASLIALGCALTSIELAAQAQGFCAQTKLPDFLQAAWIVEIEFVPTEQKGEGSLEQSLFQRATYRKSFSPSKVALGLQQELLKMKQGKAEVSFAEADEINPSFRNYILKTETYVWAQVKASQDFLRGVRFSNQIETADRRGIPSNKLGISRLDQLLLSILNFIPSLMSVLIRVPGLKLLITSPTTNNFENSHFLAIYLKNIEPHNIVEAGQLAMRAWLTMEGYGYRCQPMSSGSLCLLDARRNELPVDTKPEFRSLFEKTGPRILSEQFQLSPEDNPVWLLRFGKASAE